MSEPSLELSATRSRLEALASGGVLDAEALERALALAGHTPDRTAWGRFIDTWLAVLGTVLLLAGILFFFAYNWADLGHFQKMGLIAAAIVAAVAAASMAGLDSLSGKAALAAAVVLPGALLVVYGQSYQTGADPYGLFLAWALLIAGWVFIGRMAALWLLWLVLLNLALTLYWVEMVRPSRISDLGREFGLSLWAGGLLMDTALAMLLFALNAAALVLHEWFYRRGLDWLQGRWLPRIIACLAMPPLVVPTLMWLVGVRHEPQIAAAANGLAPLLYLAAMAAGLWFYITRGRDLFMVALALLSLMVVATFILGLTMVENVGGFLLIGLLVVGMSAGAAVLLRNIAASWQTSQ